ncbi:hypothetical protein PAPYR_10994 [Paratrimastix pyriformis]|uniref:Uncharacterized protein n=1 Tax=Paratrimastix pyriformis TaxID=342808 RepID=A0ABQ8U4Q6_9EUKA|nr:hypothetical protein PAPYR_10994 [Paratrimastix pyriformis]
MKEQPFILSRTIFRFFFISLRYLFSGLHILPCREIAKAKAVERYQAEIMSLFTRFLICRFPDQLQERICGDSSPKMLRLRFISKEKVRATAERKSLPGISIDHS